jgi:outer membrane protein assembly factor BamB
LDKMTGKTVWTSKDLSDSSGYCSPILVKRGNTRLIVTLTAKNIVGIEAATGNVLWKHAHATSYDMHAVTPIYQDGNLFVSSGYGTGSVMLQLSADGQTAREIWTQKKLDNHHGGLVLLDNVIYGTSFNGKWFALDFKTGQVKFQAEAMGKGSVITADGLLYGYSEKGTVALMKPTAKDLTIISSFRVSQGKDEHWAHPAIADGRLYIRHGNALMCYDLRAPKP